MTQSNHVVLDEFSLVSLFLLDKENYTTISADLAKFLGVTVSNRFDTVSRQYMLDRADIVHARLADGLQPALQATSQDFRDEV